MLSHDRGLHAAASWRGNVQSYKKISEGGPQLSPPGPRAERSLPPRPLHPRCCPPADGLANQDPSGAGIREFWRREAENVEARISIF